MKIEDFKFVQQIDYEPGSVMFPINYMVANETFLSETQVIDILTSSCKKFATAINFSGFNYDNDKINKKTTSLIASLKKLDLKPIEPIVIIYSFIILPELFKKAFE